MGNFEKAFNEDREGSLPYFYYISATMCIGIKTYERMQDFFSAPREFYNASYETLSNTGIFTQNQLERLSEAKKKIDIFKEYSYLREKEISLLSIEDPLYPDKLKQIKDPPPVLFLMGKLPDIYVPCVSVIGARECSEYGCNVAKRLGEVLASNGISVISGMARGVDSVSQGSALDAGGHSLAILGGGVDVLYPRESRSLYQKLLKCGGILSEFPPKTMPLRPYFALRNRLIAGMCDALCVVEAKEKSGTMITVDHALNYGKDIYAVPGRITDVTSLGTNALIRDGAGVITDIDAFAHEIIEKFGANMPMPSKAKKTPDGVRRDLTDDEILIIKSCDESSFTPDLLSLSVNIQSFGIMSICLTLVEKGILTSMGGSRFKMTGYGMAQRNALLAGDPGEEEV